MTQLELRRRLIELDQAIKELVGARADIAMEKARTEELLLNILPAAIAEELKKTGKVQPKYVPSATILFADFKAFTLLAERTEPNALIGLLDQYFTTFDEIVARHGLEKLKTIGDAYMAAGGRAGIEPSASFRCLPGGVSDAGHGRSNEDTSREDAITGTRATHRHPYGTGHIGSCRPAEVHIRYLGRRREHSRVDGSERRARPDQCLGNCCRACQDAVRSGAPWRYRGQTRSPARNVIPESLEAGPVC